MKKATIARQRGSEVTLSDVARAGSFSRCERKVKKELGKRKSGEEDVKGRDKGARKENLGRGRGGAGMVLTR